MCGIAGFCQENIDRKSVILAMNARMLHRGPDAGSYWMDDKTGWTLGHRRLAIVDLTETGAQPMISASGRFVITYNGEIYNIAEVRGKLQENQPNLIFRGTSDTEVLLEAIEYYGLKETLSMCKGMFALAVYDRKEQVMQLARDRVGEKPLYYGMVGGGFAFASDPGLFREIPGFEGKVNKDALAAMLRYSYIPAPLSIYEGIYKLSAGKILTLQSPFTQPVVETYWNMTKIALEGCEHPFRGNEKEAREELERLLTASVKQQMVADVPLGAFLSSGIDSSLVVSLMQRLSSSSIKTFTIGFEDSKYNEADVAAEIAKHLGTEHTDYYLSERELQDAIPKMADFFTEPFGDSSMIPTYFVSKLAREKVTVSLSGDAGDELFAGYNTYWKIYDLWKKVNKVPYNLRKIVGSTSYTLGNVTGLIRDNRLYRGSYCIGAGDVRELQEAACYRMNYYTEKLVCGRSLRGLEGHKQVLNDSVMDMQLEDMLDYHPDDILVKVDRAGMAVSLENRIPMLDRDVVEFAWRLPTEYKLAKTDNGSICTKKILKDIVYQYVPEDLLNRPKKGFSVPLRKWLMQGTTAEWARELLVNSKLCADGYLDKKVVADLWYHFERARENERLIWNVLMAEQWYRSFSK